jgi:hypothetical protein
MRAGNIGGRKITFIYYDDAVNPAKIVAQVPRLIESGEVALPFSTLGTEAYFGRAVSSQMARFTTTAVSALSISQSLFVRLRHRHLSLRLRHGGSHACHAPPRARRTAPRTPPWLCDTPSSSQRNDLLLRQSISSRRSRSCASAALARDDGRSTSIIDMTTHAGSLGEFLDLLVHTSCTC